jgi:hypothetical protein
LKKKGCTQVLAKDKTPTLLDIVKSFESIVGHIRKGKWPIVIWENTKLINKTTLYWLNNMLNRNKIKKQKELTTRFIKQKPRDWDHVFWNGYTILLHIWHLSCIVTTRASCSTQKHWWTYQNTQKYEIQTWKQYIPCGGYRTGFGNVPLIDLTPLHVCACPRYMFVPILSQGLE